MLLGLETIGVGDNALPTTAPLMLYGQAAARHAGRNDRINLFAGKRTLGDDRIGQRLDDIAIVADQCLSLGLREGELRSASASA
jgi:hypothetical protein